MNNIEERTVEKKRVCVITDNEFIFKEFKKLIVSLKYSFDFYYSESNLIFLNKYKNNDSIKPISLNRINDTFLRNYDVFFSLHCKQLFPKHMVENYRCINIHPGYNPYNRGWYPQVFGIINHLPVGVTIHEMDTELDHGDIIIQRQIEVYDYETSSDIYNRILELEIELLKENIKELVENLYEKHSMIEEGNINYKNDFDILCKIDLNRQGTFKDFLDYLRALTFEGYDNAYFYDNRGKKVFVSIKLKYEDSSKDTKKIYYEKD